MVDSFYRRASPRVHARHGAANVREVESGPDRLTLHYRLELSIGLWGLYPLFRCRFIFVDVR